MRSSAITSALIAYLWADAALTALTPDGVFFDVAGLSMNPATPGASAKRFVIVSLVLGTTSQLFGRRGYLDALYLVEARLLSTSVTGALGKAHDAAARLDALLDPQPPAPPLALAIPGWALMACYQEEPTDTIEVDDDDASIQYYRSGGRYRLWAAPIAA